MEPVNSASPPWYANRRFQWSALAVFIVILLVEGYVAIFVRENDFMCHRASGHAFLQGDPYGNYLLQYPASRAMMNSLLAIGPLFATRAVCYFAAIMALAGSFFAWRAMAECAQITSRKITNTAAIAAVVLTLPFLVRDLDECGLQILLLFFLSAAGYALATGRVGWSGFWLATAATYKATPILFLPYLLWKRQWRAAAWMTIFIAAWAAAPALYLGPRVTIESHRQWLTNTARFLSVKQAYPSLPGLEPQLVYNLSLNAALARYLETYPPGHILHLDHPAFVQFGNLPPLAAYYSVRGIVLALGLVLAWRFWPRRKSSGGQDDFLYEWSVLCALCAIMSPQCWKQHLVMILPAVFVSVRFVLTQASRWHWRTIVVALAGVVFLFARSSIVGGENADLLLSYKIDTFAVMLILIVVLTLPPTAMSSIGKDEDYRQDSNLRAA